MKKTRLVARSNWHAEHVATFVESLRCAAALTDQQLSDNPMARFTLQSIRRLIRDEGRVGARKLLEKAGLTKTTFLDQIDLRTGL